MIHASTICLLFLFMVSITCENAFAHLRKCMCFPRCVCMRNWCCWGCASAIDVVGMSKRFITRGMHRRLPLNFLKFTTLALTYYVTSCCCGVGCSWRKKFNMKDNFARYWSFCVLDFGIGIVKLASPSTCKSFIWISAFCDSSTLKHIYCFLIISIELVR